MGFSNQGRSCNQFPANPEGEMHVMCAPTVFFSIQTDSLTDNALASSASLRSGSVEKTDPNGAHCARIYYSNPRESDRGQGADFLGPSSRSTQLLLCPADKSRRISCLSPGIPQLPAPRLGAFSNGHAPAPMMHLSCVKLQPAPAPCALPISWVVPP